MTNHQCQPARVRVSTVAPKMTVFTLGLLTEMVTPDSKESSHGCLESLHQRLSSPIALSNVVAICSWYPIEIQQHQKADHSEQEIVRIIEL